MSARVNKALAVIAGSMLLAATPAAATWGWGGWKPKPKPPTTNPTTPTPVPEPEMLVMFGLGAAGLIVARRKKRA